MTAVAFCADVHVGNHRRMGGPVGLGMNDRCAMAVRALRAACWEAKERGCVRLYVAGDLFDAASPNPRIVAAVQDVLVESYRRGVPVTVMPGNHDAVSEAPGDHALGPLRFVSTIVDRPMVDHQRDVEVVLVPYRTGLASAWLRSAIVGAEDEDSELHRSDPSVTSHDPSLRVLVVHLGVATSSSPGYLRADPSAVNAEVLAAITKEFDFDLVVAGHWHDLAVYDLGTARAVQLGALTPTGWADQGVDDRGRLLVVDGRRIESVEIPGPRFVRVRGPQGADEIRELAARASGSELFVEWLVKANEVDDARDDLRVLTERKVVYRGAVTLDVEDAGDEAREAAAAARSADSLSDALAGYVERMFLNEGVSRRRVLELAQRFTGIGEDR